MNGAGVLTLSGGTNNTFAGGITLSGGGTLNINSHSALGTGSLTFSTANPTINNTSGGSITLSTNNVQAWNRSFTFTGSNNLNLGTGAVTMSLSPTVALTTGTLTVGGSVDLNNNAASSRALTTSGAGSLALNGIVKNTFAGSTGTVNHGSTGVSTLVGVNTFNGGLTLSSTGTVNLNNPSALGTGTFTISGSGFLDNTSGSPITLSTNNVQAWNSNFAFTGSNNLNLGTGAVTMSASRIISATAGTLMIGGSIDINSTSTASRLLSVNGAGNVILNGTVQNTFAGSTGSLTYSGGGALTLAGSNT